MGHNDTNDTTVVDGSIMALLNGVVANGYLEVGLAETTNEITMTVRSNTAPTQSVSWSKGGSGTWIIDDTTTTATDKTWSANKINTELLTKQTAPTSAGTAGQVLTIDTDGTTVKWATPITAPVTSVQGKTGAVVLDATEIKLSDGSISIEASLDNKMVAPTATTAGDVLTLKADGTYEWKTPASAPVSSVNGETGAVVLTTENVKNAAGTKTTQELIDEKITLPTGGTTGQVLTKTATGEDWVDIPECDVTSVNTLTGDVVLDTTNIKNAAGTSTVQELIDGKLELPLGTRGNAMAPVQYGGSFSWRSIPLNVNGKTGNIVLTGTDINMSSTDTTTLNAAITSKLTSPTGGTAGQVLSKTATGTEWIDIPAALVTSVQGLTGDVVLTADNVKNAAGTKTVQELIDAKFDEPTGTKANGTAVVYYGGATTWRSIPLQVNGMTGNVVLTGADIKISSTDTTKLSNAVLGAKINGNALTVTDNKIIIPLAGISTTNTAGSHGVVCVDGTNGIEVDGNGTLQFNTNALNAIGAAYKAINAAEYDETQMYQVGEYATYKGRYFVCKVSNSTGMFTTANWKQTTESDEVNNLLAQLLTFLGVKEDARRWDSVNEKIIYDFAINI